MVKRIFVLSVLVLLSAGFVFNGCGGGDSNNAFFIAPKSSKPPEPVIGTVISAPTVSPVTCFAQSVPPAAGQYNAYQPVFPGQANVWDLVKDFTLYDGADDQFDNALQMTVTTDIDSASFPYDQTYGELTFYTPTMSASDGVKTAVVDDGLFVSATGTAITGTYSAYLNATSDSRLQQTLHLAGATGTVTLTWRDDVTLCNGSISNIQGPDPTYRVVVRDTAGNELAELFALSGKQEHGNVAYATELTSFVTTTPTIVLSFEQRGTQESRGYNGVSPWRKCYSLVDDVSVLDSAGSPVEYVTNGTFETGDMTGWKTNRPAEVQNLTSGVRTLAGLDVKRSFYTVPNKLWGRWVDVLENNTVSAVTATVTYTTELGSDGDGVIYDTPGSHNRAITEWDGDPAHDRDIGMVFGNAAAVDYTSDDGLDNLNGSDLIYVDYRITVPAGGRVAIVNFILMGGTATGALASTTDITARATQIDAEAAKIANHFWSDAQYRNGMTREQIEAVANF